MLKQVITEYNEAIFDTDRDSALKVVHDAEMRGISPEDIVFKVVFPAMDMMVKSISENQDANLAQHFSASGTGGGVNAVELVTQRRGDRETRGRGGSLMNLYILVLQQN